MKLLKDHLNRDIEVGMTVVLESYTNLYLGRVSHYTNAGNLMVIYKPQSIHPYSHIRWKRTIINITSLFKLIITTDPEHEHYTRDIKIKGEQGYE